MNITPNGWPYPTDDDPVSTYPATMQGLAETLDTTIPVTKMTFGYFSTTSGLDSFGGATVAHNLGQTPTAVIVTSGRELYVVSARNFTATTFDLAFNRTSDGVNYTAEATDSADCSWLAIV